MAHGAARLDADVVAALFGGTAFAARLQILDAIAGEDSAGALVGLGELLESGHEPRRVAEDLMSASRDAFLLTAADGRVRVEAPAEDRERLRQLGETLGNAALVRMIETLGQAVTDMRGVDAADPRLVLEVALVRLSRREAGPPLQTVIERIERLERGRTGDAPAAAAPAAAAPAAPPPAAKSESAGRSKPTLGALRRAEGKAEPEAPPPPAERRARPARTCGERRDTERAAPRLPSPSTSTT